MNRLNVFLHVLLNLILIDVLESSILSDIVTASSLVTTTIVCLLFMHNHLCPKLAPSLGCLPCWHSILSVELVVAVGALALELHGVELLLMVAVNVENVDNGISPAHKVRMIGVDVRVLNLDQVPNHCVCGSQLFSQQVVHAFDDLLAQVLEPGELKHFNFDHYSSQFFVD